MTLAALLEELKEVDEEEWEEILDWFGGLKGGLHGKSISPHHDLGQALIQNSIQRACERWGDWEVSIWWKDNKWVTLIRLPGGYTDPHKVFAEESDSAAEALLAAYIAAVRASQ